ncbi:MAG: ferritin family protein [Desulfobacterales bacterium]
MTFNSLEDIIDFAIEKEQEAAQFYRMVSEEESMAGSKQMLLEFAEEEKKHRALLENVKKKGVAKSLPEYTYKWITDIKRSDYLVDMDYHKGMAYNEILILAMKREENSLKLYNSFLDNAQTEDEKALFKMLCQEEAKHKLFIETLYDDYMAKMGD